MEEHLAYLEELSSILDSGVPFTIDRIDGKVIVSVGSDFHHPVATGITDDLPQAVAWLRDQVKARYPNCAYAKSLLIN
jgi:hypothetical protein